MKGSNVTLVLRKQVAVKHHPNTSSYYALYHEDSWPSKEMNSPKPVNPPQSYSPRYLTSDILESISAVSKDGLPFFTLTAEPPMDNNWSLTVATLV